MSKKVALIIMDGFGKTQKKEASAVFKANTPNTNFYTNNYPNSQLLTHGKNVGLPEGQMGNSEVGHMNLGAGRIVYQELMRINNAVDNNELKNISAVINSFNYCIEKKKPLHIMGLISDGGVHSHLNHIIALCQLAKTYGVKHIYIHAFTDGRDTAPKEGINYLNQLAKKVNGSAKIASVIGRYYAMDRDQRWERIEKAYNLLTKGEGQAYEHVEQGIKAAYNNNITDEFIEPIVITENNQPLATIKTGDAVICANFRTDRCREITTVLTQENKPNYNMQTLPLHYTTMTRYDDTFKNVNVIFEKENLVNTLGQVLETNNKTQLRMAETEKYPHVTFFFSGGREQPFKQEKRKVIPSPKVATYDLKPEMSAYQVAENAIELINENKPDFICLNFANPDMVGHTGVFKAGIKAVETTDECVGNVVNTLLKHNYHILLTADHGNAEFMINDDGTPHTAHTTNPVPLFYISNEKNKTINSGILADIAPTVLSLMDIEVPKEMTGKNLIQ